MHTGGAVCTVCAPDGEVVAAASEAVAEGTRPKPAQGHRRSVRDVQGAPRPAPPSTHTVPRGPPSLSLPQVLTVVSPGDVVTSGPSCLTLVLKPLVSRM